MEDEERDQIAFPKISQITSGRSCEEAGPGWAAQVKRFFGWTFLLLRSSRTSPSPHPVREKMREKSLPVDSDRRKLKQIGINTFTYGNSKVKIHSSDFS